MVNDGKGLWHVYDAGKVTIYRGGRITVIANGKTMRLETKNGQ
jgi:hypothetical protein